MVFHEKCVIFTIMSNLLSENSKTPPSGSLRSAKTQGKADLSGHQRYQFLCQKIIDKKVLLARIKKFNIVLMVIVCGVSVYAVQSVLTIDRYDVSKDVAELRGQILNQPVAKPMPVVDSNLATYLSPVKQRNIFQPVEEKVKSQPKDVNEVANRLKSKIKIMGIMMDAVPQVIVENVRTRETLFLTEGDMVEEVNVKRIKADHIIVEYEGEEIKLEY